MIQEVSVHDGSIAATRHIAYDQGFNGTGFVHALSVNPEGRMNLVVNWEQIVKRGERVGFLSPACISFGLE